MHTTAAGRNINTVERSGLECGRPGHADRVSNALLAFVDVVVLSNCRSGGNFVLEKWGRSLSSAKKIFSKYLTFACIPNLQLLVVWSLIFFGFLSVDRAGIPHSKGGIQHDASH